MQTTRPHDRFKAKALWKVGKFLRKSTYQDGYRPELSANAALSVIPRFRQIGQVIKLLLTMHFSFHSTSVVSLIRDGTLTQLQITPNSVNAKLSFFNIYICQSFKSISLK